MVEPPLVSIVTPSYNSADFVEAAITSVLAQDYPNIEHLIIDGGSTDNTLEILKRYNHQLTWISEPDQGQADALNKGFRQAKGEIVGWLNADDTYQPEAISGAVRYLEENPEISLVYGRFNFIDEYGKITYTHCPPPFSIEKLLYENIIPNASMFFRRHVIQEIGFLNPQLHYVLDWEFVLRISLHYKVVQIPAIWGNFRITSGTKSVEKSDCFWPEFILVLQTLSGSLSGQLEADRIKALFRAHFLAAVEFARTSRTEEAKDYLAQAFAEYTPAVTEASELAFIAVQTATWPWHLAFKEYPQAQQTINRFAGCLGNSPLEQTLNTYLELYQGLAQLRKQNWKQAKVSLHKRWPALSPKNILHSYTLKMLLYLLLGSSLISKLRTLKKCR